MKGAGKLVEVMDGTGEEKLMILDKISLVEPLFCNQGVLGVATLWL
jgi:hypothetical protein